MHILHACNFRCMYLNLKIKYSSFKLVATKKLILIIICRSSLINHDDISEMDVYYYLRFINGATEMLPDCCRLSSDSALSGHGIDFQPCAQTGSDSCFCYVCSLSFST